ncbi:hypothetical protein ZIOFF_072158 [Zingiber officinale]|uniref:Reverse transcriptase Ty1/copia-type domain-containing protein n=1 Tax=Zingiber officinale TaxID=94328 RepID=A0A8J5EC04_ZINOF|nr:hypothetical protein ZIOFF_072158 [Zingiber officinale]
MDLNGRAGGLGIELLNQSNYKQTFDKLFNKKDEARLQHSENDLAKATQEEAISEARIQRNIVHGLRPEYIPFVTSVQGWAQQPSLEELESLLSSQESLAKKMVEVSLKESKGAALLKEGNVAGTELIDDEEDWGKCFMAENKTIDAMNSINFDKDWIVDSGCGNHLIGNDTKFSNPKQYSGRQAIVIADNTVHQVKNQGTVIINGKHQDPIMLDNVYHVPGMRKNMFSVANAVDAGHFMLFGPHDMKFLRDIKELKADVVHTDRRVNDYLFCLLQIYDMVITRNNEREIEKLQDELSVRFDMKSLGELRHFLDLEVENREDGIFVSQKGYAMKLVERFGQKKSKTRMTPLDLDTKLRREEGSVLLDARPYRAVVGSLLYLTITRLDISFSVGLISRFLSSPRKGHLEAAKKILNHFKSILFDATRISNIILFLKGKDHRLTKLYVFKQATFPDVPAGQLSSWSEVVVDRAAGARAEEGSAVGDGSGGRGSNGRLDQGHRRQPTPPDTSVSR